MLLNINTLSGCLPPIEVPPDATTRELKRRIQEVCPDTASKRLRVMQRHEQSDEFTELNQIDQPLSSCGVSDGCDLSLVIEEFRDVDRTVVEQCLKQFSAASLKHQDAHALGAFVAAISRCNGTLDLGRMRSRLSRDGRSRDFPAKSVAQMLFTMTNSLNSCSNSISRLDLSDNVLTENYLPFAKQSLSSNLTITDLDLNTCHLNSLDADCLAEIIASNTTIQKLDVSGNQLNSGVALIFDALEQNHFITHFEMSFSIGVHYQHGISCHQLPLALSSMITSNTAIQKLNLSGLKLDEACFKQMAEALQTNRTITDLNISCNAGTPVGMAALAKMIASNSTIVKLVMCQVRGEAFTLRRHSLIQIQVYETLQRNTTITDLEMTCYLFPSDETADAFAGIISTNTTVTRLKLPSIHLSRADLIFNAMTLNRCLTDVTVGFDMNHAELKSKVKTCEALSQMIQLNSTIFKLNMRGASVQNKDFSIGLAVAEALLRNQAIQELDLGSWKLGNGCGHLFANVIRSNSTLSKLYLQNHYFANNEIESISKALTQNRTLMEVDLSISIGFGRGTPSLQTASAIANMLASNSSIVFLNLSGFSQYYSDDALALIAAALKSNTTITSIDLSNCLKSKLSVGRTVFNAAAYELAEMITTNKSIMKLNLNDNWFEDEGLISIAQALKTNSSITEIEVCSENQHIGDAVVLAFCDIVPFNRTLKSIAFYIGFRFSTHETFQRVLLEYSQFQRPTPYIF